jgi:hypothetical protein
MRSEELSDVDAVCIMCERLGAGEGNRTLVISLEGCCSTIELHPHAGPTSQAIEYQTLFLCCPLWGTVSPARAYWHPDNHPRAKRQRWWVRADPYGLADAGMDRHLQ